MTTTNKTDTVITYRIAYTRTMRTPNVFRTLEEARSHRDRHAPGLQIERVTTIVVTETVDEVA